MLTQLELAQYLLQHGLLSAEAIVEGDLDILDASRRNRNFKVVARHHPGYLVKQGVGADRMASVAGEASVYEMLGARAGPAPRRGFAAYLPACYAYDREQHLLILECLPDAEDLRTYHTRRGRFPAAVAADLGRALATLHRQMWGNMAAQAGRQALPGDLPWVLALHRPEPAVLHDFSSAEIQLIKAVQRFPEFGAALDRLRGEWRAETMIHADLKWDNCLLAARPGTARRRRLKIVDWELATYGDPCWDVGSVFNDYLSFWLLSIPVTGETPPDHFPDLARYPLRRMRPALHAFWEAYAGRMGLAGGEAGAWLLRAARFAAARLLQTACDQMQVAQELNGTIVCFLQVSLNLLRRPHEGVVQLLGLPLAGTRQP